MSLTAITAVVQRALRLAPLASRIVAALFGGYALAALTSVAALALPGSVAQTVLTGMMLGFLVYAGAVIWVFWARSAARAWAGLAWVGLPLSVVAVRVLWTGSVP